MKNIFATYIALAVLASASVAFADDSGDYSTYKITSYYFGELAEKIQENGFASTSQNPMLISSGQEDVIGNGFISDKNPALNTNSVALSAEYNPTANLTLQGAFGLTKTTSVNSQPHSSWEANLGIIYKFYNNLSYGVHFAYMDTGDMYQEYNLYSDEEAVILISNQLTLSF